MFEDFLNALRNFRHNKTRTLLSLLGVIIGVASVIIITTLGESATGNIKNTFGSSGLDLVRVNSGYMQRRSSSSSIRFIESFREELWNYIPFIKKIYYTNALSSTLVYGETTVSVNASAIEDNYLEMSGLKLEYGSYFSVSDNVTGAQKIILGSDIAKALFPEGNAIGKTIILISSNTRFGFKVIGVLAEQTSGFESTTSSVYIPRGFYQKKISPNPSASSIIIQTISQEYATKVGELVKKYCEEKTGTENVVNIMSMQSMLEQYDEVMGTITLLLSGIAAISLLVGGVGIMNIMIVTVTERKREIGIRKALGATPGNIRMQFLVESATITLCGGFLGIAIGVGISALVVYVMKWTFCVKWTACLLAFFFSAGVGVFFGLNPAARAAKLDPVEALSAE